MLMPDDNEMIMRILREIQATQAEHTKMLAGVKESIAAHGDRIALISMRLDTQSGMLQEITGILRPLPAMLKSLSDRVTVLEAR
jgi:RNA binding exosome subunit